VVTGVYVAIVVVVGNNECIVERVLALHAEGGLRTTLLAGATLVLLLLLSATHAVPLISTCMNWHTHVARMAGLWRLHRVMGAEMYAGLAALHTVYADGGSATVVLEVAGGAACWRGEASCRAAREREESCSGAGRERAGWPARGALVQRRRPRPRRSALAWSEGDNVLQKYNPVTDQVEYYTRM
jgi:hypothetical protein